MHKQLQRALELSQKTGDRLIVYDMQKEDSAFVVMTFEDYEKLALGKKKLVSLTEDELLDKINRDIALWQEEQSSREDEVFSSSEHMAFNSQKFVKNESDLGFEKSPDYPFWEEGGWSSLNRPKKKSWQIPVDRKAAAEEVIEEDRQYLEEVNY